MGENPTFHAPCFVVTRRPHDTIVKEGGTSYTFVTGGPEAALAAARSVAGSQDIVVMGGADLGRQFVNAGLLDEIVIHLVPVVLGAGYGLFDQVRPDLVLESADAVAEPLVTHLTYRVARR